LNGRFAKRTNEDLQELGIDGHSGRNGNTRTNGAVRPLGACYMPLATSIEVNHPIEGLPRFGV
jgi:hypothetical protein